MQTINFNGKTYKVTMRGGSYYIYEKATLLGFIKYWKPERGSYDMHGYKAPIRFSSIQSVNEYIMDINNKPNQYKGEVPVTSEVYNILLKSDPLDYTLLDIVNTDEVSEDE